MLEKEARQLAIGGAIAFVILIALSLLLLDWGSFLEGRRTDQRRVIFKKSQSYNEAKVQDLLNYRLQYIKANPEEKKAIAETIRMMYADFDETKLPNDKLRVFLKKIKYGEN